MNWDGNTISTLRLLWSQGDSTVTIARKLGTTKNAIVGKVHRLGLDPRPSPIQRDNYVPVRAPRVPRVTGPTLPPLRSESGKPAPGSWVTAERIEILNNLWPTYASTVRIFELLAQSAGPGLPTPHAVASYANVSLKLHRPSDFRKVSGPRPPVPVVGRPRAKVPKVVLSIPSAPSRAPQGRESACLFPLGEPGTKAFRYCDEPHQNRTYCDTHQALCWVKARDRREDVELTFTTATNQRGVFLFGRSLE